MRELVDPTGTSPRWIVNLDGGGSMSIRPALVEEIIREPYRLSVKYGSTRIFLRENEEKLREVVENCKAVEEAARD